MKKYIVTNETIKDGDSFTTVCDTPEQANAEARKQWDHLTRGEKAKRHIAAYVVDETMLFDWAIDEETGEIDWTAYHSLDTFPESFDSMNVKEEE